MTTKENRKFHVVLVALYGIENAGVRYLSASLKQAGFKISIIFFKEWRNNNNYYPDSTDCRLLIDLLIKLNPDLAGISFISSFFPIARDLTAKIKSETGIKVLWGGIHATTLPEESIKYADFVCIGEGESPLLDLTKSLSSGESPENIENIWIKSDSGIIRNPCRNLIEDLDSLPHPDYSDEDKYLIDSGRITKGEPAKSGAEYRIYTSRGCPYSCSYCYNSVLRRIFEGKGEYFRHRSPEHVIEELEYAKKNFPNLKRIKFDDDTGFAFGKEWIEKFAKLYKEKIGIPFECLMNPHLLKQDLLEILKQAGLVKIQIGIESASDKEMKDVFNRAPGNENILKFAEINKTLGLEVVYDIIIDNPLSTEDDKKALFDFLLSLPKPYKLYLYSLVIFPGTQITKNLLEKGIITKNDVEGINTKAWKQFRVSMDWPRSKNEIYWLSLILLISKPFIPKFFAKWLSERKIFKKNPYPLFYFAQFTNLIRMGQIGFEMLKNGEITMFKLRQYGDLRKIISQ